MSAVPFASDSFARPGQNLETSPGEKNTVWSINSDGTYLDQLVMDSDGLIPLPPFTAQSQRIYPSAKPKTMQITIQMIVDFASGFSNTSFTFRFGGTGNYSQSLPLLAAEYILSFEPIVNNNNWRVTLVQSIQSGAITNISTANFTLQAGPNIFNASYIDGVIVVNVAGINVLNYLVDTRIVDNGVAVDIGFQFPVQTKIRYRDFQSFYYVTKQELIPINLACYDPCLGIGNPFTRL